MTQIPPLDPMPHLPLRFEQVVLVGSIVSSPQRITTPREAWVDVLTSIAAQLALADLLLIEGPGQKVLGAIVDLQFVEEKITGPFAEEAGIETFEALTDQIEAIFVELGERSRWRNQFQSSSVSAALRQLRAVARDLGPLLGHAHEDIVSFPIHELAQGGAWVIDVAPLPRRAAQAVIDEIINTIWQAKADGTLPHDLPTVLLVDELNSFSATGPTATRLAAIVRDQRHKRFGIIGLAQQLSTLHPQLLANADTTWFGLTRSRELIEEVYAYLAPHIRTQLTRLPSGHGMLESPIYPEPLIAKLPFPSWLISDEGWRVVDLWQERQMRLGTDM